MSPFVLGTAMSSPPPTSVPRHNQISGDTSVIRCVNYETLRLLKLLLNIVSVIVVHVMIRNWEAGLRVLAQAFCGNHRSLCKAYPKKYAPLHHIPNR